jgi:hypothetical protein
VAGRRSQASTRVTRSRPTMTKYPGVYKRTIYAGDGGKGITVYDLKIGAEWRYRASSNLETARQERERLVLALAKAAKNWISVSGGTT